MLFTSTQIGDNTNELCNTFAEIIKKFCTSENLTSSFSFDNIMQKSWADTSRCWWSVATSCRQGDRYACKRWKMMQDDDIIGRRIKRIQFYWWECILRNVEIICPSIARYVKHYYSFSNHLFIISGEKRIGVCEAGGSGIEELKISPFPCSPVNWECLWKKTQIE